MQINWREKAIALAEISDFSSFEIPGIRCGAQKPLAVACSGGADSLAALLLTWAKFPEVRERLFVLHFDHAVREESAADAEFVREVCSALCIGFICERRVPAPGENNHSEAELRAARLEFFAREMHKRGIEILLQGHQRDDVAETLLMRLTRGAGTDGLAAPRKISRQADGRVFVRPLLDISKKNIVSALRVCEIPWCEDATNAGTDYFRNRVRNLVLPELRAAAPFENIARSRKLAEEDADALDFLAEKIAYEAQAQAEKSGESFRTYRLYGGSDKLVVPLGLTLSDSDSPVRLPAIARRVLRKIFLREKIETDGATVIDTLVDAVCAGTPKKIQIGLRKIIWDGSRLSFETPTPSESEENFSFEVEKVEVSQELFAKIRSGAFPPTETVFLAGTPEIFVRKLLPGEKYHPLGAPGEKSVRRIFIDKKIPQNCRKTLPVFADGTGIAWIPGLPPAERFRIREAGTSALRLTYRREALPL